MLFQRARRGKRGVEKEGGRARETRNFHNNTRTIHQYRINIYTIIPPILTNASIVNRNTHVRSLAISLVSEVRREVSSLLYVQMGIAGKK